MNLKGRLKIYTLLPLLKFMHKRNLTGILALSDGVEEQQIHINEGMPFNCTSSRQEDSFARFLVQARVLDEATYSELKNRAGITGRSVDAYISKLPGIDQQQMPRYQAIHIQKNFVTLFSREGLGYQFVDSKPPPPPVKIKLDPILGFITNVARFPNAEFHRRALHRYETQPIHLSTSLIKGIRILQKLFANSSVAPFLRNGVTIAELREKVADADALVGQLFVLQQLGWIKFEVRAIEEEVAQAAQEMQVAVESDVSSEDMLQQGQDLDVVQSLYAAHESLIDANYFEVLAVGKNFDPKLLQSNYQKLIRQFHVDRFARFALDDAAKTKLNEILTIIGKSYNTLRDPARKKEYQDYLEFKEQGIPTDVGSIFQADELFSNGVKLINAGKAVEAYESFEKAIELNTSDPEYYVYLGWAMFCKSRKEDDKHGRGRAYAVIHEALKKSEKLHTGFLFLGHMAKQEGRLNEALSYYNKSLAAHRKGNIEAEREIRLINMRLEKQKREENSKKGLMGRLFKK